MSIFSKHQPREWRVKINNITCIYGSVFHSSAVSQNRDISSPCCGQSLTDSGPLKICILYLKKNGLLLKKPAACHCNGGCVQDGVVIPWPALPGWRSPWKLLASYFWKKQGVSDKCSKSSCVIVILSSLCSLGDTWPC